MEKLTIEKLKSDLKVLKDWVGGVSLTRQYMQRSIDEMSQALEELQEYEDLEEQGKLIKLPCPIGTTVYSFSSQLFIDEKGCEGCKEYDENKAWCNSMVLYPNCSKVVGTKFTLSHFLNDFGKGVFLTEDEAREALAKRLVDKWNTHFVKGEESDE